MVEIVLFSEDDYLKKDDAFATLINQSSLSFILERQNLIQIENRKAASNE